VYGRSGFLRRTTSHGCSQPEHVTPCPLRLARSLSVSGREMNAIGFNFHKGRIRVVVLEMKGNQPVFVSRKLVDVDPNLPLPELTDRYVSNLRGLLDEAPTDLVAMRLVYESESLDAARSQIMPAGLLALICHERGRKLLSFTPQALRSGK